MRARLGYFNWGDFAVASWRMIPIASAVFWFSPTEPVMAQSALNVDVLESQYLTILSASYFSNGVPVSTARTMNSAMPISDSLFINDSNRVADANSDLFSVEADSTAFITRSTTAVSSNGIVFFPSDDQNQVIDLQFSSVRWYFCSGSVSLYDLTANQQVWDYGWSGFDGTVPWTANGMSATATIDQDTPFLASHEYELVMITATQSAGDSEQSLIQLTGLQDVPEPRVIGLWGFGWLSSIGLLWWRRMAPGPKPGSR